MLDCDSLRVIALPLVEVSVLLFVEVVEAVVVVLSHLWAKADYLPRFAFHKQASVL
jgi:hypothetical protein